MQAIIGLIKKGSLLDIVKGTASTLALFTAYSMLMFAGPLAGIFATFPALFYTLKGGRWAGIAIILFSTFAFYFISPAGALLYFLQCGLFSYLLAEFLATGKGAARSIAGAVFLELLFILAFLVVYMLWSGIDPNALVLNEIKNIVSQTGAYYQKSGIKGDDLEMLRQGLKEAADFISKAYPALLIVSFGAIAGANVQLLKKVAHFLPRRLNFGDFKRFKNPEMLIWFPIAAGFALLIKDHLVTRIALNILVIAISLYFVQGLSIIVHFFERFRVPRFLRILFYFLLVVQPYLLIAIAAFGLFDLWCDFRTPKKQENL
jgi:uncharacterized protein YybS (DUF2232 family)